MFINRSVKKNKNKDDEIDEEYNKAKQDFLFLQSRKA